MTQPTHSTHVDLADPLEAELDSLLLHCSNIFEQQQESEIQQPTTPDKILSSTALMALPKSEEDILQAKCRAIPATTLKDT